RRIQRRGEYQTRVSNPCERCKRRQHARLRVLEIAAHPDISGLPDLHGGGPSGGARRVPATAPTPAPATRALGALHLTGERIDHASALLRRDLLDSRPPLRHAGRSKTEVSAHQQQIVRRPKARMLEDSQSAAAARMLQTRLQGKHLPDTQSEALRNRNVSLRLARSAIACVEAR